MRRVLILGAEGMAGHVLAKYISNQGGFEVFNTSRNKNSQKENHVFLDIFNVKRLKKIIAEVSPDYVVNCIGALVKFCQESPDQAVFINAYLPQLLNKLSEHNNFKLIHISTDCVFSGKKGQYTESDTPDETNFYGRSKALGEIINNHNLTIRTSIVGPEIKESGIGLFHWFMQQKGSINGYTKAIWAGVTTIELAKFIYYVIFQSINLTGLYHLVNNEIISKMDLIALFQKQFNKLDVTIHNDDSFVSDKSIINTSNKVNYTVPSYTNMIKEMHNWVAQESETYPSYNIYF